MTQSEYVRGELVTLRTQLQTLEARATNIEADIRNAMSEGKTYIIYSGIIIQSVEDVKWYYNYRVWRL